MNQLIKFIGVGGLLFILSLLVFYITFEVFSCPLYLTYTLVYLCFIFISYYLNATFTFEKSRSKNDLIKYYGIYLLGLIIGILLLKIAKTIFDYPNFYLVLIILVPRTLLTFYLSKIAVFKKD